MGSRMCSIFILLKIISFQSYIKWCSDEIHNDNPALRLFYWEASVSVTVEAPLLDHPHLKPKILKRSTVHQVCFEFVWAEKEVPSPSGAHGQDRAWSGPMWVSLPHRRPETETLLAKVPLPSQFLGPISHLGTQDFSLAPTRDFCNSWAKIVAVVVVCRNRKNIQIGETIHSLNSPTRNSRTSNAQSWWLSRESLTKWMVRDEFSRFGLLRVHSQSRLLA